MGRPSDAKANKQRLIKELIEARGVVTVACENAGISRTMFYKYLNRDHHFAAEVKDAESQALDRVVSKLMWHIFDQDSLDATKFYLETRGKDEGFTKRHEVTGKDAGAVKVHDRIEIIFPKPLPDQTQFDETGEPIPPQFD